MRHLHFCAIAVVFLATGCSNDTTKSGSSESAIVMDSAPPPTVEPHDSHAHASKGPHHGSLIELGNEKYHAELIHDDQSVTIYILNGSGTKATPIDAAEVTINLVHDGRPAQYKLTANPEANDPSGKCSRFTLQSGQLVEDLEHDHSMAKLSVMIDGKSYRGDFHHDHEGHDHAH
jgi:hypothetical protein